MATKPTITKSTTKKNSASARPTKAAPAKSVTTKKVAPAAKSATKDRSDIALAAVKKHVTQRPAAVNGFIDFLREQSVVGLAIGLVIGTQTKALADQLIASFINPLIGLLLPGRGTLDQKTFVLHLHEKSAVFAWGSFMATLLSFTTTAIVVYVVFKSLKLDRLTKKKDAK